MAQVAAAVSAIWGGVTAGLGSAAAAIGAAIAQVSATVASIAAQAGIAAVSAAEYLGAAIVNSAIWVAETVSSIAVDIADFAVGAYNTVKPYAIAVYDSVEWFLETIHFDLIIKVHEIAYILSADYRAMTNKITRALMDASWKMWGAASYIPLVIENTRSIVANSADTLGYNYDLFQAKWLKQFHEVSKKMDKRMKHYAQNPSDVVNDLDEWLVKPSMDAASKVTQTVFGTMENLAEGAKETAKDIDELKDSVNKFVTELPEDLRGEWTKEVKEITGKIEEFIDVKFNPWSKKVNDALHVLHEERKAHSKKIGSLVDQLKYPGDIVANVNELPEDKKEEQEKKLSRIVNRYQRDQRKLAAQKWQPAEESLAALEGISDMEIKPLVPGVKEMEKPRVPQAEEGEEYKTWFVGDY